MVTVNGDQLDPAFDDAAAGLDPVTAAKLAEEAANIAQAAEAAARAEAIARAAAIARAEAAAAAAAGNDVDTTAEQRPVDVDADSPAVPPTVAAPDEYYAAKAAEEAASIAAAAEATEGEGADATSSARPERPFDAPPGWAHGTDGPAGLPEQARAPLDAGRTTGDTGGTNSAAAATNGAAQAQDGHDLDEQRDEEDPAWAAAGGDRGDLASIGAFAGDAEDEGRGHGQGRAADASHGHEASDAASASSDHGDDPGE